MPKNLVLTRKQAIVRAVSVVGKACKYRLGAGGRNPALPHPWDHEGDCDCSGYAAWCLGLDRYVDELPWYKSYNGGWLETSAIVRDCNSPYGIFSRGEWETIQAGDLVVYGDSGSKQGHVGFVIDVTPGIEPLIAHCSRGNERKAGSKSAILTTGPALWRANSGIVACYGGYADD